MKATAFLLMLLLGFMLVSASEEKNKQNVPTYPTPKIPYEYWSRIGYELAKDPYGPGRRRRSPGVEKESGPL